MSRSEHVWRGAEGPRYLRRARSVARDPGGDPMAEMGNLFDVAMLIGIGFLVTALSSFGLNELLSKDDLTIVKSPGTPEMEIITRTQGEIERLEMTDETAAGAGSAVGTVYKLDDGSLVWVPNQ